MVGLVCVAILIAVPLYLLRKPSFTGNAGAASASASASAGAPGVPQAPAPPPPGLAAPPRLTLGTVQKVRCGASAGAASNDGAPCDSLPAFEDALKQAILGNEGCAPKSKLKGSINYVLTVDFAKKKVHIFPGASGEWRGKQARRATSCVASALKIADWSVPHQHRFYAIAVLATYAGAPSDPLPAASGTTTGPSSPSLPSFE